MPVLHIVSCDDSANGNQPCPYAWRRVAGGTIQCALLRRDVTSEPDPECPLDD